MQVKLDENLGERGRQIFARAGHDVVTVAQQGLAGAPDNQVISVCKSEHRCLVTLDLDFSNPLVFRPEEYAGIAVLRLPRSTAPDVLHASLGSLILALAKESIVGKLWIVEPHRIRVYLPGNGVLD